MTHDETSYCRSHDHRTLCYYIHVYSKKFFLMEFLLKSRAHAHSLVDAICALLGNVLVEQYAIW